MAHDSPDGQRWPAPLANRVAPDADARQVADAVVTFWRDIDDALHPVIGHRGVAALYSRSLKLATAAHPWLADVPQGTLAAADTASLHAALAQRTPAESAAAGTAMFQAFRDLLVALVGASLTDRLLRSVWTSSMGNPPEQDPSP